MPILYLEDRKDKIAEVKKCLHSFGYRLRVCNTISKALAALEKSNFDLIISGVHLELENALDFVRIIRKHPHLSQLPIILVDFHQTSFAKALNDSLEVTCQMLGATHYFAMSDFDSKRLYRLVQETIQTTLANAEMPPKMVPLPSEKRLKIMRRKIVEK